MVELVDTQDLKSCSRKRSAGSIPALSTKARYMSVSGFCFLVRLRRWVHYGYWDFLFIFCSQLFRLTPTGKPWVTQSVNFLFV